MSRKLVVPPFHRFGPEPVVFAALAALVVAACGGGDSGPTSPAPATTGSGGTAGSPSSSLPSTGSGGARPCDPTDAVCVESCNVERHTARCDTPDPCPVGFVPSLTCGADPSVAPVSTCTGEVARTDAFCVAACPTTQPSTCDAGTAHCPDGWKLLSSCSP